MDSGSSTGSTKDNIPDSEEWKAYEDPLQRSKKRRTNAGVHRNCGFFLILAAKVERLWSIGRNILTHQIMRTKPLLSEAVICLRVNERLRNPFTAKKAFHFARFGIVQQLLDQENAPFDL